MATVEKMPMLAEGHEMLSAQLRDLKAERPKIVEAIEEARAHGDLSENAEYHAAKERQGQVEATIADIEDKLAARKTLIQRLSLVTKSSSAPRSLCSMKMISRSLSRFSGKIGRAHV